MPRTILFILFFSFPVGTFCQYKQTPFTPITNEDYLLLSKREKTAAWLLFGAGGTMLLAAAATGTKKESSFGHPERAVILGGLGVLSVGASIPLFILSGKHKKRARFAAHM
jgi:hypothetical protein